MRLARARHAAILNRVFEQEDRRERVAGIGFIHQDRSLAHDRLILLPDQADHGFQQRVPWTDERRDRLLIDQALVEADSLILLLDRRPGADLTIALADTHRDKGDFPTPFLPALQPAAEMLERLDEKALDMMRLKALRFGPLHLQAQLVDFGRGHGVVGQRPTTK